MATTAVVRIGSHGYFSICCAACRKALLRALLFKEGSGVLRDSTYVEVPSMFKTHVVSQLGVMLAVGFGEVVL